ncbi:DUF3306 domain-containing protein [Halomonas sp. M20]|uniref:DUF3306 domain-containing protein n=1 Tax=Halomonas sp. M20 TaxID=2763264 RepID=UPI001D0AD546|nr:DUF3306 domain-containing protein [Halomonas sp. M20]
MSRFERWSRRKRGLETEERSDEQLPATPPSPTQSVQEQMHEEGPQEGSFVSEEEQAQTNPPEASHSPPNGQPEHIDAELPDPDTLAPESDFSAFLQANVSPALKRRALRRMFMAENYNVRDGLDDYDHDFTKMRKLSTETSAQLRSWMRKLTEETDEPMDETLPEGTPTVTSASEETQDTDEKANGSSTEASSTESKYLDNNGNEMDQENVGNASDPVRSTNRSV